MIEHILQGSDERMEQHLADERAKERTARVSEKASAQAVEKLYPGASTVRFESSAAPKAVDPVDVLKRVLDSAFDFELKTAEKAALREYAAQDKALLDRVMANTRDAVWARYKSEPVPVEGRVPREQAEAAATEVRRHAKAQRAELPTRYAPVILDLTRRAAEEVEEQLQGEVERNISQAERLGIEAEETAVIRALRSALGWIKDRERSIETNPLNATLEIARLFVGDL